MITRYPYVVVYRLVGDDVEIARILHTALQWPPAEDDQASSLPRSER